MMKDSIRMDSHKLIYHPCEVAKWLSDEMVYPIEVEISPSGTCNHRCTFCAVDYLEYTPRFLKKDRILEALKEMHEHGLKSVVCSGEGEPLLNNEIEGIIRGIKEIGLDVAMASNGVLLSKKFVDTCLKDFSWIRFSIAASKEELYRAIHRGKPGDLEKAYQNIRYAVKLKRENHLHVTLGIQCLLIPENQTQIVEMAKVYREMGVDYFTVKPYSQHTQSVNQMKFDYKRLLAMEEELKEYQTDEFKIFFRTNAMRKMQEEKTYDTCYGLPFMTHIDAKGNVWPCINFIGKEDYCYGNIYEEKISTIWEGDRKKEILKKYENIDINTVCREACRLDEMNKYLYELKHPGSHVNFI